MAKQDTAYIPDLEKVMDGLMGLYSNTNYLPIATELVPSSAPPLAEDLQESVARNEDAHIKPSTQKAAGATFTYFGIDNYEAKSSAN